ncbi:glycosyltransferase family 39 protein [Salegentibacter sp. LM13S]|uniref:ArnT family glycosyltransferase n=1 Tax=Salegentibacter lacus TaxID=2873599 RepID=UPI001CC94BD9|nr:glycosyltransferase family 39 protein [Salegentibacter lacus]MBZ9632343.1 glycosyltransferase family 39 protein [Salegentibacter lacus]
MIHSNLKFHCLALIGAALLLLVILPYKLGFSPDSIAYMEVTENLVSGNGITDNEGHLVNHWPPLFPMLVSFVATIINVEILQAGLILQIFLFYLFLLINMLILRELKVNHKLIIFFGISLIFSQVSVNFLNFLSEGLFLVLLSFSFYFFLRWIQTGKSLNLYFCSLACGLFFLSRYAGIAFLGCYSLFILFFPEEKVVQRFKNLFGFLFTFMLTISPWFIYQNFFDTPPVGREIAIHLIPVGKLQDMFITFGYWFLGSRLAIVLFTGVFLFYLLKIKVIKKYALETYKTNRSAIFIIVLFLILYPAFLIISISFFDFWTPMTNRILSPLLSFLLILIFLFFQKLWRNGENKLAYAGIVFLFLSFSSSLFPVLKNHYLSGGGYAKKMWVESETLSFLKDQNPNILTYSNGVELGKLHLQQDFELLPKMNEDLKMENLKENICRGEAQIVFLNEVNWRNYLVNEHWLRENFNKNYFIPLEDGFILRKISDE